jgi:hypothetical protein
MEGKHMIKDGHRKPTKYWGMRTVKKVARLKAPIECYSEEKGRALFNPVIAKIEWDKPPSKDANEFWFPYWITWLDKDGKEKYGQYAPMLGELALLELLQDAINQDFFSKVFLQKLKETAERKLS